MTVQRKMLGRLGEELAQQYLIDRGYTILETNYATRFGEIDIVAQEREVLVFVEVKTRTSEDQGHPFESITPAKIRILSKLALHYMQQMKQLDHAARFDVVAVIPKENNDYTIELLQNAFDAI